MRMQTEVVMAYHKTTFCLSQSTKTEVEIVEVEPIGALPEETVYTKNRKHQET
jgi:hypothetical protein